MVRSALGIWDHPRACGEHATVCAVKGGQSGSSPRMRGTLFASACCIFPPGIIPAHAGNTFPHRAPSTPYRDHPRACGEHLRFRCRSFSLAGSSPRMRGTLCLLIKRIAQPGIIPAHAGNTRNTLVLGNPSRDHPRACGEHVKCAHGVRFGMGSSPRMRGTHRRAFRQGRRAGIIPAHAGNTPSTSSDARYSGDHPRACGEHTRFVVKSKVATGSSPRMRGTHGAYCACRDFRGIIPAHAGNTKALRATAGRMRDHPRACGEHHSLT